MIAEMCGGYYRTCMSNDAILWFVIGVLWTLSFVVLQRVHRKLRRKP